MHAVSNRYPVFLLRRNNVPAIYCDTNNCNPSVILSQLVCVVDSEARAVFFALEEINHSMRNKGIEQSNLVLRSHRIRGKLSKIVELASF